jgi:hypothetical protein
MALRATKMHENDSIFVLNRKPHLSIFRNGASNFKVMAASVIG